MDELIEACAKIGIVVSTEQKQQFLVYKNHLQSVNQVLNLTAISDDEGIYMKHFLDCLLIAAAIPRHAHVVDVGSGAGFPGLVLAIGRPDLKVTCIEPTRKRTDFLQEVVTLCNLVNVTILNERAEDAIVKVRETFDCVTARAVASLNILSELCLPFIKFVGTFIAMKGQRATAELTVAENALKILGGTLVEIHYFKHDKIGERYNLEIKKIKKTPKQYPRSYAKIKKTPLV